MKEAASPRQRSAHLPRTDCPNGNPEPGSVSVIIPWANRTTRCAQQKSKDDGNFYQSKVDGMVLIDAKVPAPVAAEMLALAKRAGALVQQNDQASRLNQGAYARN